MPWSTLCRALQLKLSGRIPWLVLVPAIAVLLEAWNARFGAGVRLPLSLFLVFACALLYAAARVAYALGCPAELKGIRSLDDWREKGAKDRQEIVREIEGDKVLHEAILARIEERTQAALGNIRGAHAFPPEQIHLVVHHLKEEIVAHITRLSEHIDRAKEMSAAQYQKLDVENPVGRYICAALVVLAFVAVAVQIGIHVWTVAQQTFLS